MPHTIVPTWRFLTLVLAGLLGPLGCASYEYDILAPAELTRHVGKEPTAFTIDPLEYRLQTVENRLVMHIHNPTADAIQLVGDKSVVVDPGGQSRGLKSQTIAPSSFVKLILPPMPTRIERTGPSFGIGVGIGSAGYRGCRGYPYYGSAWNDPWYDEPRYYAVFDPNDGYWEWDGEGSVRVSLTFDRAGKAFTHAFTIGRKKM